jgi:hypothetical protein
VVAEFVWRERGIYVLFGAIFAAVHLSCPSLSIWLAVKKWPKK